MRQQEIGRWRGLCTGSCRFWSLPPDATCAAAARHIFKDAAEELRLEPALLDDCILMASELAANTLHARAATAGPADPTGPVDAELWLYLRGIGLGRELVCKVFDSCRGWRNGSPPAAAAAPAEPSVHAVTGRGLQLVHELSGGRWGHHATRARLGGRRVPGKAVWFAVPAPLAHPRLADSTGLRAYTRSADVTAARASERLSARQAARELQSMLDERGCGGRLLRADEPGYDLAVLSVCRRLTVRCRSGAVLLTTPEGPRGRWDYADLVEATEQTVRRCEELQRDDRDAAGRLGVPDQARIAAATPA